MLLQESSRSILRSNRRSFAASLRLEKTRDMFVNRSPPNNGIARSLYLQATKPQDRNRDGTDGISADGDEAIHQFQGTDSTMSHGEAGSSFRSAGSSSASYCRCCLRPIHDDLWVHPEKIPEGNEYLEWMGSFAVRHGIRSLLQGLHGRPHAKLESSVPSARCAVPHSLRFAIDSMQCALSAIQRESGKSRADGLHRLSGRLHCFAQLQQ